MFCNIDISITKKSLHVIYSDKNCLLCPVATKTVLGCVDFVDCGRECVRKHLDLIMNIIRICEICPHNVKGRTIDLFT